MKLSKLGLVSALCAAGVFSNGVALAGDTNTLTVSASITGQCKFNSATSTLNFGVLDQSLGTNPQVISNATTYWCTKGTAATGVSPDNGLNFSGGSRRMKEGASLEYIPYSLTVTGGTQTGAGKTTPLTLTLQGDITNANYVNVAAGSYSDTVILTLTP